MQAGGLARLTSLCQVPTSEDMMHASPESQPPASLGMIGPATGRINMNGLWAAMVFALFLVVVPQDAMGAAKNRPAYIAVNSINDCAPKLTTTASEVSLLHITLALYRNIGIGQCNIETNFKTTLRLVHCVVRG